MLSHHQALLKKPSMAGNVGAVPRAIHAKILSVPRCIPVGSQPAVRCPTRHFLAPSLRPVLKVSAAASDGFPEEAKAMPAVEDANCTFSQAVFNVVNVVMGVGLLSLPYALKSSGWTLVACSNAIVKKKNLAVRAVGYEDIGEEAFGKIGRFIVSSMIYVELGGCCAMMFILMGDNMFNLLGTALAKTQAEYMLLGALLMIPTVWLPDLRALSFLGVFGLGATLIVATAVTITLLTGSFTAGAITHPAVWSTFPLVFGILTFCYSGHGVFPSIQASMKEPERFPEASMKEPERFPENMAYSIVVAICLLIGSAGYYMYGPNASCVIVFNLAFMARSSRSWPIPSLSPSACSSAVQATTCTAPNATDVVPFNLPVLNIAYSIVVAICLLIGCAGYYMYGPNAADVIVFNLPAGLLVTLCSCVILINPIAKFAVTMEPVAAALTRKITGGTSLVGLQRIALRTGLAIALLMAARSVPMLALVMSLLGSFLTISISITMPALCHLALLSSEMTAGEKAWDYFVATLGIVCTVLGTTASVMTIIKKFSVV
eukprot:gene3467-13527_t